MMGLMEAPLHGGTQLNGWRTVDIHKAILAAFGLSANAYTLTQLRYELLKMKPPQPTKASKLPSSSSCFTSASADH